MGFTTQFLPQTATYWAITGIDGYNEKTFAAPVTVPCRWEGRTELVKTGDGETVASRARIFLDQDVVEGGFLYLGTSAVADPQKVDGAYSILTFVKIPGLYAEQFERRAYL